MMKRTPIIAIAALAIAACVDAGVSECQQARTFGDRYGTPDNRGPCWGATLAQSVGYGIEVYQVRIVGTTTGIAMLTYQNGVLTSASTAH